MKIRNSVIIFLWLSIFIILGIHSATAQDASIEINGMVEAVGDGTITVNGLVIDLSSIDAAIVTQLVANANVRIVGNLQNGTVIAITIEIISLPLPDSGDGLLLNGFIVTYEGRAYNAGSNQTTFTYVVTGTGTPPDLSHFDVQIPVCNPALEVVAYTPADAASFGTDPTTGVNGIKWDSPLQTTQTRTYTITFAGAIPEGSVTVAVKGGSGFEANTLPGPGCSTASVDIEKFVSVDSGATWQDADDEPGPDVALDAPVSFRFVIANSGQTQLTNLVLADNVFDVSTCALPATLAPGAFFECTVGPVNAEAGQHTNLASVIAVAPDSGDIEVQDSDPANYFGGERPSITITKYVSKDSSSWDDADDTPGLRVDVGDDLFFRFVVNNDGNVPVSTISLNDSSYPTTNCTIPTSLDAGASFECVLGPFDALEGQHTNTVTVSAKYNDFIVINSDTASYFGGEMADDTGEMPVTIVIEGPVQQININIITIYDIDIEINPDDPILRVIRIGDNIRVEGNATDQGDTIIIVAVTIIIIDVDIVISDDHTIVWRDDGNCGNPPPPWAPAHGWRRRCGGGASVIIIPDRFDVPPGCKITGIGNNNPRLKCSNKRSKRS